jgi:hypothetical protein
MADEKTIPVVLVVNVPDDPRRYGPAELARTLVDAMERKGMRNNGMRWPMRFGGAEMLAPPAPPAESTTMSCDLWHHCCKHPAFGVAGLTSARADCPHFVAGGVLDPHKTRQISWATTLAQIGAVVQGGLCVCAAYEPAEESSGDAQP